MIRCAKAALVAAVLLLSGCAWLTSVTSTPTATTIILQNAVELGVGQVIEALPAAQRAPAAQAVSQAVKALEAIDTDNQTSLAQLNAQLAARLAKVSSLSPLQQQEIDAVITSVVAIIAGKVTNGVLSTTQVTTVNTVLNWVAAGVAPYST
jgi:hypothetical protein